MYCEPWTGNVYIYAIFTYISMIEVDTVFPEIAWKVENAVHSRVFPSWILYTIYRICRIYRRLVLVIFIFKITKNSILHFL